ncbi:MAG: hypothetical protein JF616_02610 [Fibrobacteres bacterium]|nr:hypothetical protein [Fibrobacterota bacterium]
MRDERNLVGAFAILLATLNPLWGALPAAPVRQFLPWQGNVFAATDSGLFVSADTGRTWNAATAEWAGRSVDTLVEDGRTLYAMAADTPYALSESGAWVSLCGGDSGNVACPDSKGKRSLAAFDSGIVLLRKFDGYQSNDQGSTWRACDRNLGYNNGPIFRTRKGLYYFGEGTGIYTAHIARIAGSGIDSSRVGLQVPMWLPLYSYTRVNVVSDSVIALHFMDDRRHSYDTMNPYFSMVSHDEGKTWARAVLGWSPNRGLAQADSEIYYIDSTGALRRGWVDLSATLPPKPAVAGSGFKALAFAYDNLLAADSMGRVLLLPRSQWHHDRIEHSLRIQGRTYGKFADLATPSFRGEIWLAPGDTLHEKAVASYGQYNSCGADLECWKQYTQVFQSWHAIGKAEILPDTLSPEVTVRMGTEAVQLEPVYASEASLGISGQAPPGEPRARLSPAGLDLRIAGESRSDLRIRFESIDPSGRCASADLELKGRNGDYSIPLALIPGGAEAVRRGLRCFRVRWAGGNIRWKQSFL